MTPDSWTLPTSLILDEFPVTEKITANPTGSHHCFVVKYIAQHGFIATYPARFFHVHAEKLAQICQFLCQLKGFSPLVISQVPIEDKIKVCWAQKKHSTIHQGVRFHGDCFPSWMSIRGTRSIPCMINLDKPCNPGGNAVNANPRFRGIKAVEYIIPYCVATEQFLHQGEFMWRDVNHVNGVNRFSANSFKVKLPEV